MVLLGAGTDILALLTVHIVVHGLFQHCNVDYKVGPLNYVFSLGELHRWHHSKTIEESNTNYGNNVIFWDLVFGSWFHPKDRMPPADIGLVDQPDFPTDYVGRLLSPFRE